MVNASLIRTIVGIVGNVISLGLLISPAPTFYKIIKKKDVEEFKSDPYLATLMNCAFWVFYGMPFVHPNSTLLVTINGVGFVFEVVYVTIFYIYATSKGRKKILIVLLGEIIFLVVVVLITMFALHGSAKRSLVVGIICDIFNIMMYTSPLTIMAKVIKTKSVKYMPFWLSLANFLNGLAWTTYALLPPFDIYVLISNGIGAVSGLVQLILYACYYSGKGENNEDDNKKDDLEMKPTIVS
ncbi:bidirectional sugar transporter SWEET5 [Lathyrus oleraceus]|uniref:bidirectional sugar transporter SWEET5 n=1 Tax=Pisum sativum TaxID=3888 RepID=UPI0021D2A046|nr:bidirectional sugar transporter SWEET5-like [Pisum sativum]